jgi:hypothetical protein
VGQALADAKDQASLRAISASRRPSRRRDPPSLQAGRPTWAAQNSRDSSDLEAFVSNSSAVDSLSESAMRAAFATELERVWSTDGTDELAKSLRSLEQ